MEGCSPIKLGPLKLPRIKVNKYLVPLVMTANLKGFRCSFYYSITLLNTWLQAGPLSLFCTLVREFKSAPSTPVGKVESRFKAISLDLSPLIDTFVLKLAFCSIHSYWSLGVHDSTTFRAKEVVFQPGAPVKSIVYDSAYVKASLFF